MSLPERPLSLAVNEIEIRAAASGKGRSFTGYAAVFGAKSEPMPWVEIVEPTAFRRSLSTDSEKQTAVVDHDDTKLLASRRARTMNLSSDAHGLLVEIPELPNTSYANDLIELHDRGEVRGMSFEFWATRNGAPFSDDRSERRLVDVKLGHVTVLTGARPAYPATTAAIRSLARRVGGDSDEVLDGLADALAAIHEGRELTTDQLDLVRRSIDALAPAGAPVIQPEAPAGEPESVARFRAMFAKYQTSEDA